MTYLRGDSWENSLGWLFLPSGDSRKKQLGNTPIYWGWYRPTKTCDFVPNPKPPKLPELLVGVGIMVAHNPLHRSQRAGLPHWALTLGTDVQVKVGIRSLPAVSAPTRFASSKAQRRSFPLAVSVVSHFVPV